MGKHDAILHLPHFQSEKRAHMPTSDRAAQFAPFAALTGYDLQILEAKRETSNAFVSSEERDERLNQKLQKLSSSSDSNTEIEVIYFTPDIKKEGGAYLSKKGIFKRVDLYNNELIFMDHTKINIHSIYDIYSSLLEELD